MALPDIAEIGDADDAQFLFSDGGLDHGARIALHGLEQHIRFRCIEFFEIERRAAGDLISDRRLQEADRRADARPARHDDALDTELFGERTGMQWRSTS